MRDESEELRRLVLDVLGEASENEDAGAATAWQRLAASDLTLVSLPESVGGSGGTLVDATAVLSATAEAGQSLPLLETTWLAGWLDAAAGRRVPAEPVTLVVSDEELSAESSGDEWSVSGMLRSVPWSDEASAVYVVVPHAGIVVVLPMAGRLGRTAPGTPHGRMGVSTVVAAGDWFALPGDPGRTLEELHLRDALARTALIAGGSRSALAIALRHAAERVQFGRPLNRYQVIQHYLARMAARGHAVAQAQSAAAAAFERSGIKAAADVHAAKAVASAGVEEITTLAHQVLGAIGTSAEHPLHLRTMSLWQWREDAGSEFEHADALADAALADGGDVWSFLAPALRAEAATS